jgi:hypothetical protein
MPLLTWFNGDSNQMIFFNHLQELRAGGRRDCPSRKLVVGALQLMVDEKGFEDMDQS